MLESSQYTCAEQFSAYISGNAAARLVIASTRSFEASSAEMKAWTRIIAALNIADNDYAFVSQNPKNQDANLQARQLVKVVEGIDPIALICCDEVFFSQLKAGYAQAPATENHTNQFAELIQAMPELRVLAPSLMQTSNPTARDVPVCKIYANEQGEYLHLLGRPCIVLRNFGAALATQQAKQQVWILIKHLEPLLSSNA